MKGAQGVVGGAGGAAGGGSRFGQAIGSQMASKGGPAGKIGMSYANGAKQAPPINVPNMRAMLQGIPQGQQQGQLRQTQGMDPFLQMLMGGGR